MISNEPIKVKIKKITSICQEKCINGLVHIAGVCEATTEEGAFKFEFKYKGKSTEEKKFLLSQLQREAEQIYVEKKQENRTTLSDFIYEIAYDKM